MRSIISVVRVCAVLVVLSSFLWEPMGIFSAIKKDLIGNWFLALIALGFYGITLYAVTVWDSKRNHY